MTFSGKKKLRIIFWLSLSMILLQSNAGCKEERIVGPPEPPIPPSKGSVKVWLTRGDKTKLLNPEADLSMKMTGTQAFPLITLDTTQVYQEIDGFGAALTGSSAYLLNKSMNPSLRSIVLNRLFDPEMGIGISFLRLTIGASDFSLSEYSYDDPPAGQTDFSLQHFSLSNGDADVVPVMKEILQKAPAIQLMGSPWSPPAWMKTNQNMRGGRLKADCYPVYADYFVRYIQEMKNEGITISSITVQNEPLFWTAGYPCMEMQAADQMAFIKDHLGPKFSAAGINAKIILYDHNWDNTNYAISILNDDQTKGYVAGTAFHGYGGDVSAMSSVHSAHPDKGLYFTEISGGTWATNFSDNLMWNMRNIFIGSTINWSRCALLWNLVLDQNGAPHENNVSVCRGVVTYNTSTSQVVYNEEFYSIGHFSKFVRPGAFRVGTNVATGVTNVQAVSFLNKDGSKALVVCNYGSTSSNFSVQSGDRVFDYSVPPKSVVTFRWM
jgi:glucosylceramidase